MKNQNGSTLIGIIIVIITAVVLGAGFLAWKYYNDQEQDANRENQIQPSQTQPSQTQTQTQDQTTTITIEQGTVDSIKIALIALDDGGVSGKEIGCNDSVVYVTKSVQSTASPLNTAFIELFSIEDIYYGESGLENIVALTKDTLNFEKATIENGVAKIYLSGQLSGLRGVCDDPRLQAQIEETALQFLTVKSVETFLNNELLNWQAGGRGF